MERYGCQCQTNDHTRHRKHHHSTTTNSTLHTHMSALPNLSYTPNADTLNNHKCHTGQDEIRAGHNKRHRRGILEPHLLEQRRAEIHERVEAAQLLKRLKSASNHQSSSRRSVSENPMHPLSHAERAFHLSNRFNVSRHHAELQLDLLFCRVRIHAPHHLLRIVFPK